MAKQTVATLDNRMTGIESSLKQIMAALTGGQGQAVPVSQPVSQPDPAIVVKAAQDSEAERLEKIAILEAKAAREAAQVRSGKYRDDLAEVTFETERDDAGNPVMETRNGIEKPKQVKKTKRLKPETRAVLDRAMQTDFAGVRLSIVTPEQIKILEAAGKPLASSYALPSHVSKGTGNRGFGQRTKCELMLKDSLGNAYTFSTGTGFWLMAHEADIERLA